jgi:hypothetical protein
MDDSNGFRPSSPQAEPVTDSEQIPPAESVTEPDQTPALDSEHPPSLFTPGMAFDNDTSVEELTRQLASLRESEEKHDLQAFIALWQKLPRIMALKRKFSTDSWIAVVYQSTGISQTNAYGIVNSRLGDEPHHSEIWHTAIAGYNAALSRGDRYEFPKLTKLIGLYKQKKPPKSDEGGGDDADTKDRDDQGRSNRPRAAYLAEIEALRSKLDTQASALNAAQQATLDAQQMVDERDTKLRELEITMATLRDGQLRRGQPPQIIHDLLSAGIIERDGEDYRIRKRRGVDTSDPVDPLDSPPRRDRPEADIEVIEDSQKLRRWPGKDTDDKWVARSVRADVFAMAEQDSIMVPEYLRNMKPEWYRQQISGRTVKSIRQIVEAANEKDQSDDT